LLCVKSVTFIPILTNVTLVTLHPSRCHMHLFNGYDLCSVSALLIEFYELYMFVTFIVTRNIQGVTFVMSHLALPKGGQCDVTDGVTGG
jgi:hypothetical protein